jgi:hypothetical protein
MNWNDPRIDWKNPGVIELWEYRGGDECIGCGRSRGVSHQEYCDRERCKGCGCQMIMCQCEQSEVIIPENSPQEALLGQALQDAVHKHTQEIIINRKKILDEFCKAYLAENMQDTPIRDLTLNEQQIEPTEKFEGFSYKYWFSAENPLKWTKFSDEIPDCEWIWVSDYLMIELYSLSEMPLRDPHLFVWAEAKIIYPPMPKLPRHSCKDDDGVVTCLEDSDGILFLHSYEEPVKVKFCPYCGFKGVFHENASF